LWADLETVICRCQDKGRDEEEDGVSSRFLHGGAKSLTDSGEMSAKIGPRPNATIFAVAESVATDNGSDRLARQRSRARARMWEEKSSGMWCLYGRFDPETGVQIGSRIEAMLATKFAENVPDGCPEDPSEKQGWLLAQAVAAIMLGEKQAASGKPEAIIVVDTTNGTIKWPFDVLLPDEAVQRFLDRANVHFVDTRDGGIRWAPGNLNFGLTTRLANRAQRRALRAIRGWPRSGA